MNNCELEANIAIRNVLPEIAKQLRIANRLKAYALKLDSRLEHSHRQAIDKILLDDKERSNG